MEGFFSGCVRSTCSLAFSSSSPRLPLLIIPLSQIRDNGIINNGPKQPTVADLEAQVKAGMSISLMDLADAAHREKKKSVLEQLKSQPTQERPHKTAPKKSAEKEL